jgi:hypothetical protein
MGTVHLLWHVHEISPNKTDDKLIGVYTTKANAILRRKLCLINIISANMRTCSRD